MSPAALARLIAPLALVIVIAAVLAVLASGGGPRPTTTATTATTEAQRTSGRRSYRVRPGDALSEIAERYDTTVADLVELNPDIDPQALQAGDRLRLRR